MRRDHLTRQLYTGLTLLAMWGLLLVTLATACGGSQRQKTLHASFVSVSAACDGLDAWDTAHQEQLVAQADPTKVTKDEVRAKLDAHRAEMDKLYAGCTLAYRAIAAASTSKDELSLNTAVIEAKKLYDAIMKLKGAL